MQFRGPQIFQILTPSPLPPPRPWTISMKFKYAFKTSPKSTSSLHNIQWNFTKCLKCECRSHFEIDMFWWPIRLCQGRQETMQTLFGFDFLIVGNLTCHLNQINEMQKSLFSSKPRNLKLSIRKCIEHQRFCLQTTKQNIAKLKIAKQKQCIISYKLTMSTNNHNTYHGVELAFQHTHAECIIVINRA